MFSLKAKYKRGARVEAASRHEQVLVREERGCRGRRGRSCLSLTLFHRSILMQRLALSSAAFFPLRRCCSSSSARSSSYSSLSLSLSPRRNRQHQPSIAMASSSAAAAKAASSTSTIKMEPLDGPEEVTATVARINVAYAALHEAYEENFWATKMGLKVRYRESGKREAEQARGRHRIPSHPLSLHLHHQTQHRTTPRSSSLRPRPPSSPSWPTLPTSKRSKRPLKRTISRPRRGRRSSASARPLRSRSSPPTPRRSAPSSTSSRPPWRQTAAR